MTLKSKTNELHRFRLTLADRPLTFTSILLPPYCLLNKKYSQLITIAPHSLTMLNTTNTEFSSGEVWFTDQNSKQLEIEDSVIMTLIIG